MLDKKYAIMLDKRICLYLIKLKVNLKEDAVHTFNIFPLRKVMKNITKGGRFLFPCGSGEGI